MARHRLLLALSACSLFAGASRCSAQEAGGDFLDSIIGESIEDSMNDLFGGTEFVDATYENDLATIERLLKGGLNPNKPLTDPDLPSFPLLYTAIEAEKPDVIRLLVRYKADVNGRDPEFKMPMLSHAAACGSLESVKLLLTLGADATAVDKFGGSALEEAAFCGAQDVVKVLQGRGLKTKWPLHLAAGIGDLEALRKLATDAPAVNKPTPGWRNTPLMFAVNGGQLEATKVLLAKGANPDLPNMFGSFAIMNAAQNGSQPLCELLLAHGADINARPAEGQTTLDWVRGEPIAEYLQSKGAKATAANEPAPTVDQWWAKPNPNPSAGG